MQAVRRLSPLQVAARRAGREEAARRPIVAPKERAPKAPVERFEKPAVAADLTKPVAARIARARSSRSASASIIRASARASSRSPSPARSPCSSRPAVACSCRPRTAAAERRRSTRPKPFDHSNPRRVASPSARLKLGADGDRSRLGWLGPAIVVVGRASVAAASAIWYMVTRTSPRPGAVIDDDRDRSATRRSSSAPRQGGERSFIELHDGGELKWQALIPRYAGAPGAPGDRVERTRGHGARRSAIGRAEVFAFAMQRCVASSAGSTSRPSTGRSRSTRDGPDHADRSRAVVRARRRRTAGTSSSRSTSTIGKRAVEARARARAGRPRRARGRRTSGSSRAGTRRCVRRARRASERPRRADDLRPNPAVITVIGFRCRL